MTVRGCFCQWRWGGGRGSNVCTLDDVIVPLTKISRSIRGMEAALCFSRGHECFRTSARISALENTRAQENARVSPRCFEKNVEKKGLGDLLFPDEGGGGGLLNPDWPRL